MQSIFKHDPDTFYKRSSAKRAKVTKRLYQAFIQELNEKSSLENASKSSLNLIESHDIPIVELEERLNTNRLSGLEDSAVIKILSRDGINELSPINKNLLRKWTTIVFGGPSRLLWIGLLLSLLSYQPLGSIDGGQPDSSNLILATIIISVIFFRIFLNYFHYCQINFTSKVYDSLINSNVTVVRNKKIQSIMAKFLVIGDVVLLEPGLKVPGDIRLFEVDNLKLDRSLITGETEWVDGKIYSDHQQYTESCNIALGGSYVVQGTGKGIVLHVGDQTVMGHINQLKPNLTSLSPSILAKEFESLSKFGVILGIALATFNLVFFAAYLRPNYPTFMSISSVVTNATGLMLCFLLDGLSLGLTLTSTLLAKKMIKRGILIKELYTIEKLGYLDIICLDKTGTLTKSSRKIATIILEIGHSISEIQLTLNQGFINFDQFMLIAAMYDTLLFNCQSKQDFENNNILDDQTFQFPGYLTTLKMQIEDYKKSNELEFFEKKDWSGCVIDPEELSYNPFCNFSDKGQEVLIIKGSVDYLLPKCKKLATEDGRAKEMSNDTRDELYKLADKYRRMGQKLILLAYTFLKPEDSTQTFQSSDTKIGPKYDLDSDKEKEASKNFKDEADLEVLAFSQLVYVGMLGISNVVRAESLEMVQACRKMGVKMIMITGDHPVTSAATAKEIGLFTKKHYHTLENLVHFDPFRTEKLDSIVLLGRDLKRLSPFQIDLLMEYREIVLAKANSNQKLGFIQQLQCFNKKVGMIGDGLNDLPAIKQADVGITMADASDVVQAQADVMLLDNDLTHIFQAIQAGRNVFITSKALMNRIPAGSLAETLPIFTHLFLGLPSQLSSLMIVIVSLISETLPSVAVMATRRDEETLNSIPKGKISSYKEQLLTFSKNGLFNSLVANFAYFLYLYLEANLTPSSLIFLFDKWSPNNPNLNLDSTQISHLTCSSQSIYFITIILLNIIENLMETNSSKANIFQAIFKGTYRPNIYFLLTASVTLFLTLSLLYIPNVNNVFGTCPPNPIYWPVLLGIAMTAVTLVELGICTYRFIKSKRPERPKSILQRTITLS